MSKPSSDYVHDLMQGIRRATETNLKLQQETLTLWTRYWPGFSARQTKPIVINS